jgi:hypothetical protein
VGVFATRGMIGGLVMRERDAPITDSSLAVGALFVVLGLLYFALAAVTVHSLVTLKLL